MAYVLVHHKVKDFVKWKAAFDDHASTRKEAATSKGGYLFQTVDDKNEVIVLLEVEDLAKGREFIASDDLREIMQQAGVEGPPHIHFVELADRPSA